MEGYETEVRCGTNLTLGNTGVASTEFLTRLFSHRSTLYDEYGKIVLNDNVGKQSMAELLELQKYISGKPARWWTTAAKEFGNGNIAMMINFSNYASEILGYHSKIVGNVGIAMVPGGNPIYGGGSLAVSKTAGIRKMPLRLLNGLQGSRWHPGWLLWEVFLHVLKHMTSMIL